MSIDECLISANIAGMVDSWRKPWPLGLLLFGLVMLLLAVIGTFTGKTHSMGGRGFDRATEPFHYWLDLVIQYLGAAFLIWSWFKYQ